MGRLHYWKGRGERSQVADGLKLIRILRISCQQRGAASAVISEGSGGVEIKNTRRAHFPTVALTAYERPTNEQCHEVSWDLHALGLKRAHYHLLVSAPSHSA